MSNVSQHLFSGAVSGFTSGVCLQPFDLLKTRMQQGNGVTGEQKHLMTIVGTARQIIQTQGVLGLWRGTTPTILRNVPGVAMYFTGLNQVRTFMATSPYFASVQSPQVNNNQHGSVLPKLSTSGNLAAGAITRTAVGFVLNPFAVLKARFESDLHAYSSLRGATLTLIRGGPSELFRGFVPSAFRDAPYAGLFVVFYESIKHDLTYIIPPSSAIFSTGIHGIAAASAGAIATMATHPFDVVKTKMQVRSEYRYRSFFQTVLAISKDRGLPGFFDGAVLRLTRKIFSSAIGWAVYEGILILMRPPQ
ncbi:solute carrier family 25 member 38 [Abortiporus biennis]|nr:solute carrier family 25 member 38 [Abortiporus biennis]